VLRAGEVPLTHFHAGHAPPDDPELARDLGLALVELAKERSAVSGQLAGTAIEYLDRAVKRGPEDAAAWEARGKALLVRGKGREALESCERALALAPGREESLAEAARSAEQLGDRPGALAYWLRLRAVGPRASSPRFEVARLRSLSGDWEGTARECRELLQSNPAHINARLLLVAYHLETGDRAKARAEFDAVLALRPADPDAMRRWFAEKSR
jgi:tetratricopeptide (TPR) repeat protein